MKNKREGFIMDEKIVQGKIIAEFLEYAYEPANNQWYIKDWAHRKSYPIPHIIYDDELFKYSYDWNWQVPVWGKIALAVKTLLADKKYTHMDVDDYLKKCDKYSNAVFQNKPEDGHKIIIELIQWYNTSKDAKNDVKELDGKPLTAKNINQLEG